MRSENAFRTVAAMFLLFVPVFAAYGQDRSCTDAATTAAMRACENSRYEKAEQALKTEYDRLMHELTPSRQKKLSEAQRAWVAFRVANAEFLASAAEGGTLVPLIKISALADMAEARTTELRNLAKR